MTAIATASHDRWTSIGPDRRVINDRLLWKFQDRQGFARWKEYRAVPAARPIHNTAWETGAIGAFDDGPQFQEIDSWGGNPADVIQRLQEAITTFQVFDPRPRSPLHDELDRAPEAGFPALVEEFHARNKVKPRPTFPGAALIGEVSVSRGARQLLLADDALCSFLGREVNNDWGDFGSLKDTELNEDQRWCCSGGASENNPMCGPNIRNAVALEDGSGLVQSRYAVLVPGRGSGHFDILTFIGRSTWIFAGRT